MPTDIIQTTTVTARQTMEKDLGIMLYVDDHPSMYEEFDWIYKSWIHSGNWRTSDLIVVCHPNALTQLPMNDPGVIKIPQMPLSVPGSVWEGYPYINSIACLSGEHTAHLASTYTWLLRTDADVFLTSNLATFRPSFPVFGRAHYGDHPDVWRNIVAFAEKHGLEHHRVFNCGSSLLARSADVLFFLAEQTRLCNLLIEEFQDSPGQWPGWSRDVLTMYAAELVANHYYNEYLRHCYMCVLDTESFCVAPIDALTMHIHAVPSHSYFSKWAWRKGDYQDADLSGLDITKINQYCHWIAATPLQQIKQSCTYPY
jgi:hypothetical protein